jgi:hypothetical protein
MTGMSWPRKLDAVDRRQNERPRAAGASDLGMDSGLEQPMKQMMEACVGGYAAAPITAK